MSERRPTEHYLHWYGSRMLQASKDNTISKLQMQNLDVTTHPEVCSSVPLTQPKQSTVADISLVQPAQVEDLPPLSEWVTE